MSQKKGLVLRKAILNETQQESWSERDSLPTQDPIGDTDEVIEFPDSYAKDVMRYMSTMNDRLIEPEGKVFGYSKSQILEFEKYMNPEPKCNCGTFAVYGKVPADAHMKNCSYRKYKENL